MTRLEVVQGDLTEQEVDAIVNAANQSLLGGGGVDGAIHRRGGPEILAECETLGGCPTGEVRLTGAGRLPARYVVHAVGPRWRDGERGWPELLASAHRHAVDAAAAAGARTIAFPAISTGIYGYPVEEAAPVAVTAAMEAAEAAPDVELVRFVLFSPDHLAAFRRAARDAGYSA
jgi:O-acetyl-ADP-ribose deacetylase (regulator of RNase III)